MANAENPQVVIIGSGPSGLAAAIELGMRGIRCLLVERNDRVGYAPRAKTTNVRTRTHMRRWGIADKLAEASPFGIDYPSTIHFVTKLGGHGLARIENASNCDPTRSDLYPEHGQWIPQYKLEQVMREHLQTLPSAEVLFSTEFVSMAQDENRVSVSLKDRVSGEQMTVACDFLIGADGARSAVRESIGATLQGTYGLSRNYNIVFRAPGLAEAHSHGQGTMYWQLNPLAPSLMGPMDKDDVWFFMPTRLPEGFKITAETAPDFIRLSTGLALPFEVLSTDEWVASSLIADRYREGRTWLIGDACHLHPPFGGYGMNMGVADGVDLGWKLAASLQGWAGPALLDSYEIERRAIHEEVIAEAAANHAVLSNDLWSEGLENSDEAGEAFRRTVGAKIVAAKTREFHTLRTVLGGSYKASPVIDGDSFEAEAVAEDIYVPSSRPGCLAPHFWRADGTSIYDALGNGFALVCLPGADPAEIAVAVKAAAERCIPLTVVEITGVEAHDRYAEALTLVRPDQYVAWRGSSGVANMITLAAGHEDHNPRRGRADLEVRPVLFAKHPG